MKVKIYNRRFVLRTKSPNFERNRVINMEHLSNIKNKLLVEQTEEQIYDYILTKPILIGERLPNEFKLGELFDVGRSTVREAVKLLISKGILEIRRGAGTYVTGTATLEEDPLGLRDVEDKFTLAMELAEVRMIFEPSIAEMAAMKATAEDVKRLEELCNIIEGKIGRGETYIQEDVQFHTCVAECSKNKVIQQILPLIDTTVMMFVNVTHKKLTDETVRTHKMITEAIREKDYIGARMAMMMHMTYNRDMIKRLIKEREVDLI